jgi:hypothetical protein
MNETSSSNSAVQSNNADQAAHADHARRIVFVELNGDPVAIPRGRYSGRDLKLALHVPIEHVLEQVCNGKFEPIENDSHLVIHGDETFVAHCGQGQSS